MATAPQTTGIKNADDLIKLADAFGLAVTVETTGRETLTSYTVRISIPVPPAYAGTELGRAIAGDTFTLLWTKAHRAGARGRLEDATAWTIDSRRKVRTQQRITAHVHLMGHQSARYVRETAPQIEDVVDAPHALFIDGEQRSSNNLSAAFIRGIVRNRRQCGKPIHQDADGAIVCETRRYVPTPTAGTPAPAEEQRPERFHMRTVSGGTPEVISTRAALDEINHAMMDGQRDVREMSAVRSSARIVYKDDQGTVELRPATAEDLAPIAARPAAQDAEEQRAAEAAREAYAFGVRLEAQQLATNQVIQERARESLASVLHEEAKEGKAGFVFRTNHLAVCLRGVTSEGNDWPLLTEALQLHLEHYGWFAEPSRGHGVRITPPGDAGALVMEGKRRNVATAHAQALAEHAQR